MSINDYDFGDEIFKFSARLSGQKNTTGVKKGGPKPRTPNLRGRKILSNPAHSQRVIAIITPHKVGKTAYQTRAHLAYLQREGAGKSGSPVLFAGEFLYEIIQKEQDRADQSAPIDSKLDTNSSTSTHQSEEKPAPKRKHLPRPSLESVQRALQTWYKSEDFLASQRARARRKPIISGDISRAQLAVNDRRMSPLGSAFYDRCKRDRHLFRVILSPERGDKLDLEKFTKEVMKRVERDLGTKLEWVATSHHNTSSPHVHVAIRGVTDDGRDLIISPDYIKTSLRLRAEQAANSQLGLRTEFDRDYAEEKQVNASHFTSLDRELLKVADSPDTSMFRFQIEAAKVRPVLRKRLKTLEALQLATYDKRTHTYSVRPDLKRILREIQLGNDIQHRLVRLKRRNAEVVSKLEYCLPRPLFGRIVGRGQVSEFTGQEFFVIEDLGGHSFYIEPTSIKDLSNLQVGDFATFSTTGQNNRLIIKSEFKKPLQAQISALGVTWLDTVKLPKLIGEHQGLAARTLLQAHAARQVFLRKKGLAQRKNESRKRYLQRLRTTASLQLLSQYALSQGVAPTGLHDTRVISGRLHTRLVGRKGDYRIPLQNDEFMFFLPPVASLTDAQGQHVHVLAEAHPEGPSFPPRVYLLGQSIDDPHALYYTEHDKELQLLQRQRPNLLMSELPPRLQTRARFLIEAGLLNAAELMRSLPDDLETRLRVLVVRSRAAQHASLAKLSDASKPVGPCVVIACGEELNHPSMGWVLLEDAHGSVHHRPRSLEGNDELHAGDCILWSNDAPQLYAPTASELESFSSQPIDYVLSQAAETTQPVLQALASQRAAELRKLGVDPHRSDLLKALQVAKRQQLLSSWCANKGLVPNTLSTTAPFYGEVHAELLVDNKTFYVVASDSSAVLLPQDRYTQLNLADPVKVEQRAAKSGRVRTFVEPIDAETVSLAKQFGGLQVLSRLSTTPPLTRGPCWIHASTQGSALVESLDQKLHIVRTQAKRPVDVLVDLRFDATSQALHLKPMMPIQKAIRYAGPSWLDEHIELIGSSEMTGTVANALKHPVASRAEYLNIHAPPPGDRRQEWLALNEKNEITDRLEAALQLAPRPHLTGVVHQYIHTDTQVYVCVVNPKHRTFALSLADRSNLPALGTALRVSHGVVKSSPEAKTQSKQKQ